MRPFLPLAALTAAVALTACGPASPSVPPSPSLTPAPSSPAVTAAATPLGCAEQVSAWYGGPGGSLFGRVREDIDAAESDASAGQAGAAASASAALASAAAAARARPVPSCTGASGAWAKAMTDWVRGGKLGAGGQFTAAAGDLNRGTGQLAHVTAAIKTLGG